MIHDLYIDDKRVVLHLVEGQRTGSVHGHELREQIRGQMTLHPNVLDALFENQHLILESWKLDEQRSFFWAVGYCDSHGNLYVRFLYWDGSAWDRACDCLSNYYWDDENPAAVLARVGAWNFGA